MRAWFLLLLVLVFTGCQSNGDSIKSPFKVTGFWANDEINQKKIVDQGTGVLPSTTPLKGRIETDDIYTLGPGDKLLVLVQNQKKISGEYIINEMGYIRFPLIGLTKLSDLTLPESKDVLEEELKRYIRRPSVVIDLMESVNKQVFVYGALGNFGPYKQMEIYKLNKPTKLLTLLASLGGPKPDADVRNISVTHANGTREIIDLNRILIQGDQSLNINLKAGDVVYIPSSDTGENKVVVLGAVLQQGVYSFKSEISALQAVALARSFTKNARVEDSFVIRTNVENPYLLRVNFKKILMKGESQRDVPLQKGDIVFVPDNIITNYNRLLDRINPTLKIIQNVAGAIIDADSVLIAFDRGFGESNDTSSNDVTLGQVNQAADRAVSNSSSTSTTSTTP